MTTCTAPSFIELREWAGEGPAPGDFLAARRLLDLPAGPVSVGTISLAPGGGSASLDGDEFILLLSGAVTFVQNGGETALSTGDSAVLPAGASFTWWAEAPAQLLFMRCDGPARPGAAIARIDRSAPLDPSGAPLAELLLTPAPQCRNHTDYSSADGFFVCGTWDSTPYHRRPMSYGHYELMHLLEGEVTIGEEGGDARTFRKGDIFLVRQGARCSWESRVHVRKVYAIYRPA